MQQAVHFAAIVELLGRLWLREVTLETLSAMAVDDFRETYLQLGGFVPESVSEDIVEELSVEYCGLLIGPKGQLSPIQSVWIENQFQTESAASMSRFFELLPGYQPESNLSDHLGVQLDFISTLLRYESQPESDQIIERFVNSHLLWALKFLKQVEHRANSKFYRGLAVVTFQLIESLRSNPTSNI